MMEGGVSKGGEKCLVCKSFHHFDEAGVEEKKRYTDRLNSLQQICTGQRKNISRC